MGPLDWIAGIFMIVFHRVFKTFYVVVYFYFCPFLVLLVLDFMLVKNPALIPY
jgi:hypothetical protein